MSNWKSVPLGLAVVDETEGGLAIHHVTTDGALTGIWFLPDPTAKEVADRLAHWIVVGTQDGIKRTEAVLGEPVGSADLAGLVDAAKEALDYLEATWQDYRDAEPKKRANLVPLAAKTWPTIADDGDAAAILSRVGVTPFPESTPADMRDVLALARLVQYLVTMWADLETERTSRPYLHDGTPARPLPPAWSESNPPWWPKAAA